VRAKTEIEKFHGMELTSIINMIDVEQPGANPLVDLDHGPSLSLDSGPRSLGSSGSHAPLPASGGYQEQRTMLASSPPPPQLASPKQPTPPPFAQIYPPPPNLRMPQRFITSKPVRSGLNPWIVIVAILLVAGIVAIIVAMSGPNVAPGT
jgi:hypothetical protein